jgi:hypothetical protein
MRAGFAKLTTLRWGVGTVGHRWEDGLPMCGRAICSKRVDLRRTRGHKKGRSQPGIGGATAPEMRDGSPGRGDRAEFRLHEAKHPRLIAHSRFIPQQILTSILRAARERGEIRWRAEFRFG